MIMMAPDARKAQQPGWGDGHACEQLEHPHCPQYDPSIFAPRTEKPPPSSRRRRFHTPSYLPLLTVLLGAVPTSAVFVKFENCLSEGVQTNSPLQLQFVPMFMDAKFNTTNPENALQVTVWGNVTGSGTDQLVVLPPLNDPYWDSNQANLGGKIQDEPDPTAASPKLTTLTNKVNVLTYEPWSQAVDFCAQLINVTCPLAPRFFANGSVPCLPFPVTCR
jgi:hypothetical protein